MVFKTIINIICGLYRFYPVLPMCKTECFITQFYPILPNWFYPLGKTTMPTLVVAAVVVVVFSSSSSSGSNFVVVDTDADVFSSRLVLY